jgi:hypothetical protein
MPRFSRPTVCLILVAGVLIALQGWDRINEELQSDRLFSLAARWSSPELMRRQQELAAQTDASHIRWQRADEIAYAVAEGRMSLFDGAARASGHLELVEFGMDDVEQTFQRTVIEL